MRYGTVVLESDWTNLAQHQLPPSLRRRLGERLHPATVTDTWYHSGCDPNYPMPADMTIPIRLQWWASRRLRGIHGGGL